MVVFLEREEANQAKKKWLITIVARIETEADDREQAELSALDQWHEEGNWVGETYVEEINTQR